MHQVLDGQQRLGWFRCAGVGVLSGGSSASYGPAPTHHTPSRATHQGMVWHAGVVRTMASTQRVPPSSGVAPAAPGTVTRPLQHVRAARQDGGFEFLFECRLSPVGRAAKSERLADNKGRGSAKLHANRERANRKRRQQYYLISKIRQRADRISLY